MHDSSAPRGSQSSEIETASSASSSRDSARVSRGGVSRRAVLTGAGLAGAGAAAAGLATPSFAAKDGDPFTLGVASGDPWPDGFVIWTRLALIPEAEDGRFAVPQILGEEE